MLIKMLIQPYCLMKTRKFSKEQMVKCTPFKFQKQLVYISCFSDDDLDVMQHSVFWCNECQVSSCYFKFYKHKKQSNV